MKDRQGNEIKIGVAYQYVFGMPGPDVTCLIVESINEDGTVNTYDVSFKMKVDNVKPEELWRPLKHTWDAWSTWKKEVIEYCGAQALDLN